ncbi:glycerol kinase isoform X2 [Condylostylus longicornis]|nr:glycerol kinase isoform X2 [Condylostylus longicornis]
MSAGNQTDLIGVINAGTNHVSFSVYTTPDFKELISDKVELKVLIPQDGWFEINPIDIIEAIHTCTEKVCKRLTDLDRHVSEIVTIGITNQRETTIVWDKITGQPLHNAISWNDIRTNVTVDRILARIPEQDKNHFKNICGLPIVPYFSALKIRWLKDNIPAVKKACREGRCLAGTVDSWIVWNLTGGVNGGLHVTDVTNASRTLLMNIETLHWDPILTKTFSIHTKMLPEIRSSSEIYGQVKDNSAIHGINISGILGNQQANLLGQMCFKPGQAKSTYRSGCFLLCNTGEKLIFSEHGLLTTIAYKLGKESPCTYALEGAVAVAGAALKWLQNNLEILGNVEDAEKCANLVNSTADVYFVPAFTGLYSPYWRKDARGTICGLTHQTTKNHIIRAALESICFQNRDIIECITKDCGIVLNKLYADGPLSENALLMQLQADILGIPVCRSQLGDTTTFGAAMCAAQADGINAVKLDLGKRHYENNYYDTFLPTTTDDERDHRYTKWKKAIHRSLGWVKQKSRRAMTEERYKLLASIPAGIFIITSFMMLVHAKSR